MGLQIPCGVCPQEATEGPVWESPPPFREDLSCLGATSLGRSKKEVRHPPQSGWLVVGEAFKAFSMKGKRADLYFCRSHEGLEVDLIIQIGTRLIPVEIKLTSTPSLKHVEPLNKFKKLTGAKPDSQGLLVCRIEKPIELPSNNQAIPWHEFSTWLSSML